MTGAGGLPRWEWMQLVQFVDDLRDLVGGDAAAAAWVRAHPGTRALIVGGQFDAVLDQLLTERARAGRYVDTGAIAVDEDFIAAPEIREEVGTQHPRD